MPAKIKRLLWPYELGRLPAEADLKKVRTGLAADEQKLVDKAFDRYLDAEVKKIRKGAEGSIEERLSAFERAKALYATFRAKPQAEQIKEVGAQLNQDAEFKKEWAAKQAYDKVLLQCAAAKNAATIRPRLMEALAKQYKDTLYGTMAANDGKAVRPGEHPRLEGLQRGGNPGRPGQAEEVLRGSVGQDPQCGHEIVRDQAVPVLQRSFAANHQQHLPAVSRLDVHAALRGLWNGCGQEYLAGKGDDRGLRQRAELQAVRDDLLPRARARRAGPGPQRQLPQRPDFDLCGQRPETLRRGARA